MYRFLLALFVAFSLLAYPAYANDQQLSQLSSWQHLLHYESNKAETEGVISVIHSPKFFLATDGRTNAETELQATLAAMLEPLTGNADEHAKCRFPARLIWLRQHYPQYQEQLADITCPAFHEWAELKQLESASLVFANGYLGNPASYYGHVFLKFNRHGGTGAHLTDQTLNYGAIDSHHDDPVSYILKGVFGGYDGGFSPVDFFYHDASYGETELRDLWEYRLQLTPDELQYLIAHAWEVLHKRYTYYFFHDNCAFRVGELLEVLDGISINPKNRPWVIPQALLQQLAAQHRNATPLLQERRFHPSRQTRLYQRFAQLNTEQRQAVGELIAGKINFSTPAFTAMELPQQQGVIDSVLDYYQFRQKDKKEAMPEGYVAALAARFQLPPGMPSPEFVPPAAPDTGNRPSWIQLGVAHDKKIGTTQTIRLRPAYYDALDVNPALAKNGGLSMGEITFTLHQQHARLSLFNLIAIDSINPAITGLPGDQGRGWRLRIGGEQEQIACQHCFVARMQADASLGSWLGSPHFFGEVFAGGAVQEHSQLNGNGFVRAGVSFITRPSPQFSLRGNYEIRRPFQTELASYAVSSLEGRLSLAKDYDLRVRWDKDQTTRVHIGIGYYW